MNIITESAPQSNYWMDILKTAIVPLATILAVFVGAFINAKLNRKQKIRDELFSYKVKAYVSFAETIATVEQDYLNGLSSHENVEIAPFDNEEYLGPLQISTLFQKKYKENYLFLDNEIREKSENLTELLYLSSNLHLRASTTSDVFAYHLIEDNKRVREKCNTIINNLYKSIGLNEI